MEKKICIKVYCFVYNQEKIQQKMGEKYEQEKSQIKKYK